MASARARAAWRTVAARAIALTAAVSAARNDSSWAAWAAARSASARSSSLLATSIVTCMALSYAWSATRRASSSASAPASRGITCLPIGILRSSPTTQECPLRDDASSGTRYSTLTTRDVGLHGPQEPLAARSGRPGTGYPTGRRGQRTSWTPDPAGAGDGGTADPPAPAEHRSWPVSRRRRLPDRRVRVLDSGLRGVPGCHGEAHQGVHHLLRRRVHGGRGR